jgi:hypothetical protein
MASIIWIEREGWDGRRRVPSVSLQLNRVTFSTCKGQAWSPCSLEGGLGTWADEHKPTREVEIVGICSVSLCPQHYTRDARDRPELRSFQYLVPEQP